MSIFNLTDFELGWVVGFLEGEGYFGIYKHANIPTVQASSVDRDSLERLSTLMNVGPVVGPYEPRRPGAQPFWKWQISSKAAHEFMKLIEPHMGGRRGQRIRETIELTKDNNFRSIKFLTDRRVHE